MIELVQPVTALRDTLERATLDIPRHDDARADQTRRELVGQLDDYVLPRLVAIDAPTLVVLGGSTGSGKSTLVNSLVGSDVSMASVVRPSTRVPVLVCCPEDREWFVSGHVLPDLPRSTGERPTGTGLHLVTSDSLRPGLALLDAPDIDSIELANHQLAAQLLGAADAWLFVTTAARYADAVPWEYLRRARERAVALAVVVNRIPPGATDEITTHLDELLRDAGLRDVPLLAIPEREPDELDDGRLRSDDVSEVWAWLDDLVRDDETRVAVIRATLDGVLDSVPARTDLVIAALGEQQQTVDALRRISQDEYDQALTALDDELADGSLLRGEVLDRWREYVSTSAFMERVQRGVGRIADRVKSLVTGRKTVDVGAAREQIESNLMRLIRNHADRAALATVQRWEQTTAGPAVLSAAPRGIDRPTPELEGRLTRELADWQDAVLRLVQEQSGNRVAVGRILSTGLNGLGVAVMILVFSQTGGVTGAEAGVAAGTAAVTQTLLTAIFGETAVRDLVRIARDDLRLRLAGVFEDERGRFDQLLSPHEATAEIADLQAAVRDLRSVR